MNKNDAYIICDIDGTIADCTHRLKHIMGPGKKDWGAFFDLEEMAKDEPIMEVLKIVNFYNGIPPFIQFVTARPERTRGVTMEWLNKYCPAYDRLYMRADGDTRPDTEVKKDIYEQNFDHPPVFVLEDRQRVVKMWKSLGLRVLDVGPGEEV